jgi:hypothetical protein
VERSPARAGRRIEAAPRCRTGGGRRRSAGGDVAQIGPRCGDEQSDESPMPWSAYHKSPARRSRSDPRRPEVRALAPGTAPGRGTAAR